MTLAVLAAALQGGCAGARLASRPAVHLTGGYWQTAAWTARGRVFAWGSAGFTEPTFAASTAAEVAALRGASLVAQGGPLCAIVEETVNCLTPEGEWASVRAPADHDWRLRASHPSVCLVDDDELLCSYHSGRGTDLSWIPEGVAFVDVIPGLRFQGLTADGRMLVHDESLGTAVLPAPPVSALVEGGDPHGVSGCVVLGDRTIRCWREWLHGVDMDETAPGIQGLEDPGLSEVVLVATGRFGGPQCAALADGSVWCWGPTGCGRYRAMVEFWTLTHSGEPPSWPVPPRSACATERHDAPVRVPLGAAATDVSVGDAHGCAALEDGTVWCWGGNYAGQLGDGTRVDSDAPVRVLGLP